MTWSQISSGSHSRQMPWGENIEESRIRSKNVSMLHPVADTSKMAKTND
jgi:hypothetical protein